MPQRIIASSLSTRYLAKTAPSGTLAATRYADRNPAKLAYLMLEA